MDCRTCHRAMLTTSSHVLEEGKETITITRWRCKPCHETAEEIILKAGFGDRAPRSIRYTVATLPPRTVTTDAGRTDAKGTRTYARRG